MMKVRTFSLCQPFLRPMYSDSASYKLRQAFSLWCEHERAARGSASRCARVVTGTTRVGALWLCNAVVSWSSSSSPGCLFVKDDATAGVTVAFFFLWGPSRVKELEPSSHDARYDNRGSTFWVWNVFPMNAGTSSLTKIRQNFVPFFFPPRLIFVAHLSQIGLSSGIFTLSFVQTCFCWVKKGVS